MSERYFMKAAGAKRCGICHNVTHNVIRRKDGDKNVGAPFFICDKCIAFIKGLDTEPKVEKLPFEPDEEELAELEKMKDSEDVTKLTDGEWRENPENPVSPEASSGEEMNNNPSDETSIEGTEPAKMPFFKLKSYAKSKGVDIEVHKTKEAILAELEKLGE